MIELPASEQRMCPLLSKVIPMPNAVGSFELQTTFVPCVRGQCAIWNEEKSCCGIKETGKCLSSNT